LRRQKVIFSPVEVDYLKSHKSYPINQLCQALSKTRTAIKNKLAELEGKDTSSFKAKKKIVSKIGKRKDCDNQFLRSSWEANSYRYLKQRKDVSLIEVEPTVFSFAPFGILKGQVSYCPDFKVSMKGGGHIWIEVKGFLKREDKTKLKRFKKYYPEEFKKLAYITGSKKVAATKFFDELGVPAFCYYQELKKEWKNKIANWEE